MDPRPFFLTLARHDVWATKRLLDTAASLDDAAWRRDLGLFFRSIHGTLNHLLVAEHLLWFPRFAEGVSPKVELGGEVEPERARLVERLLAGAARWQPLIEGWSPERFDGTLGYTTIRGALVSLPFAPTLAHVFNHGTHHRGQVTAALTGLGATCPELDLVYMLQEEAGT